MINIHLYPSPFLNESRILREAGALARMGLFDRIDLVGTGQTGLPETEYVQDGIQIIRFGQRDTLKTTASKVAGTVNWSHAVFQKYRDEPVACINCHSVSTLPLAVMLKKVTGAKLIYDAHELETEANGLGGMRKYMTKRVERMLIGHADHCIFVGNAINEWYIQEYGLTNSTVIYNCPLRQEPKATDYFREKFGIPAATPVFLYQGLIGEGRGIRLLVEAFSGLADKAVLVVMGYGLLTEWFTAEAARHKNIFYHPAVPPDRLVTYTCAADYGLSVIEATSISYDYCMPNKLFEYVMAKKPVLVSPTVEQRQFVESQGVGEVASDMSPQAVRGAVLKMLERSSASLESALNRTREEFCWERQETKLQKIFLEHLGFQPRFDSAA